VEAAFFDLDRTVIARSSMMTFARAFHRAGLLSKRAVLRSAWTHLRFSRVGAGPEELARIRARVLQVTTGWPQDEVRRIVAAGLADAIDPIVYREAADLLSEHRRAGRLVYLVSAAPEEIVQPIGEHLGVDGVVASRADLDPDGCYLGTLHRYCYGPTKADCVAELAAGLGIDLPASWAYSDSATDLPMLEAVGHPVAVNPDKALRDLAGARGWPVLDFRRLGRDPDHRWAWPALASTAAIVTTTGGVAAWLRRRGSVRPPASDLRLAPLVEGQLARSFLAAKNERPAMARRMSSFFMPATLANAAGGRFILEVLEPVLPRRPVGPHVLEHHAQGPDGGAVGHR